MILENDNQHITESRFYMWRAIFAMAHVDGIVTVEETDFLSKCLDQDHFSPGQRQILMRDLAEPQNIGRMFAHILREEDKLDFFILAEELSEADGDFSLSEKKSLNSLKKENILGFPPSHLQEKLLERKVMREPLN